jgi:hypothetical protein
MPTLEGGKRTVVRKVPRNKTTEHEGRVSQPGVPAGPRNSAGGTKTVVTVHDDGHVTAVGPEAKDAAAEARSSLVRVRATNAKTKVTKAGVEVNPAKGTPAIDKVPGAVKSVIKALERQDPTSAPTRSAVESEAKNVVKVAKQSVTPGREARGIVKLPSSSETRAAAAITAPVAGDARVVEEAADVGKGAVAKAAAKGAEETARKAEDIRTAPQRAVQAVRDAPTKAKEFPGKVKELPKDVRDALETPDARRAAAKSAGKTAAKHPIKVGVPAAAILPPGAIPGDASDRARALLTGLARAVEHPGDLATATAHGVLGAFTAPLAVSAAAIESAKQGNISPLTDELGTLAGGVEDLGKKLVSGNPEEVEQTFRHELGLTPFIPVPHVAKAISESDKADEVLGSVRGRVEDRRSAKRDATVKEVAKAEKEGSFVSAKQRKKIEKLEPITDTKRDQPYINKKTGKLIEKQRARHEVSRIVSRTEGRGNYAAKGWSNKIAKALRKSKAATRGEDTISDAQKIFNQYGIPLDETGKNFVRMLHESYPELKPGDVPAGVHLDRHSTKYLLDHPESFTDPHLRHAVELFDKQSEKVGTSERHRYLPAVRSIINPLRKAEGKRPILLPEEMVPEGTSALMDKLVKGRDPAKDPWSRDEVLNYAKELHGKDGDALRKQIEATLVDENGDKLMRSPEHGGAEHGIATTRSTAYTDKAEKDFADQARAEIKARGLREPAAYVGDELPDALKGNSEVVSHSAGIPLKKIWPSRGDAAASGNAISDFEHLMHKSVEAPRHRASLVQGLDELVNKGSRKIEGKRAFTDDEARRLENEHKVPAGTAWVRIAALKNFIKENPTATSDDIRAAIENESSHVPSASAELKADVGALEFKKGEKLVPMDENYINEFLAHMKPIEGVTSIASKATRAASRMILNSPAFALIQPIQEGVPLAAALGRDIRHVPEAIKNLKAASKLDPDDLAAFKAASGSSAGLFGVPSAKELRADGYLDPARMTARPEVWKRVWHLVNGKVLGEFDRNRAGWMREVGMEARTIGDLKRASKGFNVWRRSTNNLFKDMEGAVKDMKGMTPEERHAYIAEHPELQDRIQKAADGMAGNWNSFTVFEKHIAPLTLFYTFQRYSALWMLYHFPLDHPVAATALTLLGQVNAKQLQDLAAKRGSEPNILDYTMPVYSRGKDQEPAVLPAGKRAFPGLSTIQTAGVTGQPSQLLGELPPELGIPVEAAAGKNSYTGNDIEENLLAFMGKQTLNLNPAVRLFLGLTGDGTRSAASEAFHEQDPLSAWRSVVDPYIGQSGSQYGNTKKLEKAFSEKYGEGKIPSAFDSKLVQKVLFSNPNGHVDPRELQHAIRLIHKQEASSDAVKKAEQEATGESSKGLSPEQEEALKEIEGAWTTGPNGEGEEGTASGNPFSEALSKQSSGAEFNPFSKALSESSGASAQNPFSAALAGG